MLPLLTLTSAFIFGLANGLDIDVSIQGDGADEGNPVAEGRTLTMIARITLNQDDSWTTCTWTKTVDKDLTENGEEKKFACYISKGVSEFSCGSYSDSELNDLSSSITLSQSQSECRITVRSSKPGHTGEWVAHISGFSNGGYVDAIADQIDAYVSSQAEIHITDPDVENDRAPIKYDLSNGRPRIEATCTSTGASPQPTFLWYIDDDNNEIREGDANAKMLERDNGDWERESTITFSPSLDDLCNKFKIDVACSDFSTLTFSLMCRADQGNYYRNENSRQSATVLVEVSGSSRTSLSLGLVIAAITTYLSFHY